MSYRNDTRLFCDSKPRCYRSKLFWEKNLILCRTTAKKMGWSSVPSPVPQSPPLANDYCPTCTLKREAAASHSEDPKEGTHP